MVIELKVQYCREILLDSFETYDYETFYGEWLYSNRTHSIFKIHVD